MENKKEPIGAIILAAGKGTRLNSNGTNKVALPFRGKPIVEYAVDVMEAVADCTVVVVGAFADSVKEALKNHPEIIYAEQKEQLGTGHATKVGFDALLPFKPVIVLIGYGDHMMFYKTETVKKLLSLHKEKHATMSIITVMHNDPDSLAWGRIVRDENGNIVKSVEHKDATESERAIKELNAGFYVVDCGFLSANINNIPRSGVSGEYYVNALIEIAISNGKTVFGMVVPFEEVGIGINRMEELEASQKLHSERNAI